MWGSKGMTALFISWALHEVTCQLHARIRSPWRRSPKYPQNKKTRVPQERSGVSGGGDKRLLLDKQREKKTDKT
jgi:hypothetical protein